MFEFVWVKRSDGAVNGSCRMEKIKDLRIPRCSSDQWRYHIPIKSKIQKKVDTIEVGWGSMAMQQLPI